MRLISSIPFGPQHPVLPEPIHLSLQLNEEIVEDVDVAIGYMHRGIEKGLESDFKKNVYLSERVCGICSYGHTNTYCMAVESMMGIEIPERAKYIRVIVAELERIHSHMLILGLIADALGYENLFMQFWRDRELSMDILEKISGNRVNYAMNTVGGVRRDIDDAMAKEIEKTLDELEPRLDNLRDVLLKDYTLGKRTIGKGVLPKEIAEKLCIVGPNCRASGVDFDLRKAGYFAYGDLKFKTVLEERGDNYARMVVRMRELYQSVELIREALSKMPKGDIAVKVKGNPEGEGIGRTEMPRGELLYYAKGNGTKNLERVKIRTPTYANVPGIRPLLQGAELADVPVIVVSLDPCIACTDR